MHDEKNQTLCERFRAMDVERSSKLERSREHAAITIPGLLPEDGLASEEELPVPYASLPAEGIMNLAARMVSVLYPLNNVPFFELQVNDALVAEGEDTTEEQKMLDRVTRRVMDQLMPTNYRSALFTCMQHLIVVGDVLLHQRNNYEFQVFRLDQYVVRRSPDGAWRELIVQEWVDPHYLPLELQGFSKKSSDVQYGPMKRFEAVYTRVWYDEADDVWNVESEFRDQKFDAGTSYQVAPYFPLRWSSVAGEDYGRSMVEDSFGDIRALDVLRKALIDGSILNSEFRWLVNPGGITMLADFDNSVNGSSIPGIQGDIVALRAENQAQVEVTLRAIAVIEASLGRRFLMNSAVQPQGERVTARQVSILAQELEQSLGGTVSLQTKDIQVPVARRTMYQMSTDGLLPPQLGEFVKDTDSILKLSVKAGLEVLRREVENEKLALIAQSMSAFPPEAQAYVNWPNFLNRWVASFGVETVGIIKTEQEVAAIQQAQAQAAMAQQTSMMAQQTASEAAIAAAKQQPQQETE